MADPQAATATQLKNIQARTGRTIAELHAALAGAGLAKHGERRSWLMQHFKLGYGDANTVALFVGKPLPLPLTAGAAAPATAADSGAGDPLATIYSGSKAGLRPLHDAVMKLVGGCGPFEQAPKKTYISLRRKKQFAMLGPATRDTIELGLNAKDLPPHPRLKLLPPGSMCQASTRIAAVGDADAQLAGWIRQAYDAAG